MNTLLAVPRQRLAGEAADFEAGSASNLKTVGAA
jgi:hypothetical protein